MVPATGPEAHANEATGTKLSIQQCRGKWQRQTPSNVDGNVTKTTRSCKREAQVRVHAAPGPA